MDETKTSDHIQINIRMQNSSQEPSASFKAPNDDLKDMDDLCAFKIKIESHNFDNGCTKPNDYIQFKIKMPNSSQEPPAPSKDPTEDLKDINVLCTLKSR